MSHKTIVNGTIYDVQGGKCLVNGTSYDIKKGRTLIGGTGYDITFAPPFPRKGDLITMNLDGTTTQEPTEFQQRWSAEHWLLQYDLMFGRGYALQRMGLAGLSGVDTGK